MDADSFKGLECYFLGHKVGSPVGIAPTAFHQLACGEGEMATVKAAESMNTVVCISSMSNIPIEELAHASPSSLKILQVYLSRLDDFNQDIFKRAKDVGFKGIALTVDSNILGNRENEVRNNFSYPSHLRLGLREKYLNGMTPPPGISLRLQSETLKDNSFDWSRIKELK